MILRNWLSASLLARDKIAFQRFAQRWREKGKDCQKKTLSNLWVEALPPPVKGVKRQKGGQHQREGREMHGVGINAPRIAFKMETLAQAATPFYSNSMTVETETNLFSVFLSILVQTVTFICLHTTLTLFILCSVSLAVFLDKTVQSFRNRFSDLNCKTPWRRKQVCRLNVIPPGGLQSYSFAWGKVFVWDFFFPVE